MGGFVRAYADLIPPDTCARAVAAFEAATAASPVPALRIDDRDDWRELLLALHGSMQHALERYCDDCPTFAVVHPRVAPVGYVIVRRAVAEATAFHRPTTLRPRPPLLAVAWLAGDGGSIELEAQPDVIAARPGTVAVIPTSFEYCFRESPALTPTYVLTTAFTFAGPPAHG